MGPGSALRAVRDDSLFWVARLRRASLRAGLHQALVLAVEARGGEHAGGVGPGVEAQAVFEELRLLGGRVAVDDHLAEGAAVLQELVADPEQVALGLVLQRHAR